MSSERLENQDVRKLTKVGGHTISVSLPIELIRQLGWKTKQKVSVRLKGKNLEIKDWKK